MDNRTQVAGSIGGTVSSTYDAGHNLQARSLSGGGLTAIRAEFDYDAADRRTLVERYNAATSGTKIGSTDYAFDDGNRLTGQIHRDSGGTATVTYANVYDAADRITSETRNGTPTNYDYDVNNQLTNDSVTTFSYDPNGNRTMAGHTTGIANRLATDGTWTYTHDVEGNLTKKSQGASAETWTYGYDHRNQLLWTEKRETDGGTLLQKVEYEYDVYNNLIEREVTVSGATHTKHAFEIVDNSPGISHAVNEVWADLTSGGSLTTRYLIGEGQAEKLARSTTSTANWLLTDRLGSLREVLDASGAIVATSNYNGFGGVTSQTGTSYIGDYTFHGMRYDSVADLHVTQNRQYGPGWGGWFQEDPIRFAGGDVNLRRFVGNGATNAVDLTGLEKTFTVAATNPRDVAAETKQVSFFFDGTMEESMRSVNGPSILSNLAEKKNSSAPMSISRLRCSQRTN